MTPGMVIPAWSVLVTLGLMAALAAATAWGTYHWGVADGRLAERAVRHQRELQARKLEDSRARWLADLRRAENDAPPASNSNHNNTSGRQPWPTETHERIPEWAPRPATTAPTGSGASRRA